MPHEGEDSKATRRRFLKATGAAALTTAAAGCLSDTDNSDQDNPTSSNPTTGNGTTDNTDQGPVSHDSYPYAPNETAVDKARQVMEEAGYGPNNKFDLSWLQYTSDTWKEMANTIRARLNSAHINMNISEADFGSLLNKTKKGEMDAYTLGWIADYPAPQNFMQLVDPPNTNYNKSGSNGARLFWTEDSNTDPEVRQFMVDQFNRIQNNPGKSDEAKQIRGDAAKKMEEGMWESAALIPIYHTVDEPMWYDHVDYKPYGGMGGSRAKTSRNVKSISGRDRVRALSGTFNTLDPIASGNTESGSIIMDMFDAPLNYRNGTTEVENLLVKDYTVSDDLTTYEFTLKEGVQFQKDWGELTADDVVYSLRRLIESRNSTNLYFPISVMGITRETKTETYTNDKGEQKERTVTVPGSAGVTKTGKYSFEISLKAPFSYALSVLSYAAFSIVPENIVGDIEGYDGKMSYEEFSTSNPIGSGPFQFAGWQPGNGGSVSLDTFDGYHGEGASYDGVDRSIITGSNATYNAFLNNEVDLGGVPTSKYDPNLVSMEKSISRGRQVGTYGPMSDGDTVNMAQVPSINTYYVAFNMQKVPKPVRQAMAYVVNHDQFVKSVFKGRGESAFHLQPPQIFQGGAEGYKQHWQQ